MLGGARGREGLLSERLWRPTGADRRGRGDAQSELLPGGQILPLKALSIHPLMTVHRLGWQAKAEEGAVRCGARVTAALDWIKEILAADSAPFCPPI